MTRCEFTCRDGSQCGKTATDKHLGKACCHIHKNQTQMAAAAAAAITDPDDVLWDILRTSKDDNLRAKVANWLKDREDRREQRCDACVQRRLDEDQRTKFVEALTEDEFVAFSTLMEQFRDDYKAFRERVYARHPALRPDNDPPAPTPETGVSAAAQNTLYDARQVAKQRERQQDLVPDDEPEKPSTLDRSQWKSVGIYERDGIPSHDLGNEYAHDVINGVIPLDVALRREEDRHQQLFELGDAKQRGTLQ